MKFRSKRAEVKLEFDVEDCLARVVSDAAIASAGIGDGRVIPVLIVDTSDRPEIDELIRVHEYLAPGDVTFVWGQIRGRSKDRISLILHFTRPIQVIVIIEFNILKQGGLVDQILTAKALYLQPGRDGDRLKTTFDQHRLLIELPETEFSPIWDELFRSKLEADFRRKGLSRKESKRASDTFLTEWRKFGSLRIGGHRVTPSPAEELIVN
jgi:hypothetical protein